MQLYEAEQRIHELLVFKALYGGEIDWGVAHLKMSVVAAMLLLLAAVGCGRGTGHKSVQTPHRAKHPVVVIVVDSLTSGLIHAAMHHREFKGIQYLVSHGHSVSSMIASFPSMTVSDLSTIVAGAPPSEHKVPGLVWFDVRQGRIVNYGNNFSQSMSVGTAAMSKDVLFTLNQVHLSKHIKTIFEDLGDMGYSTGAINMLVYRGLKSHQLLVPAYARPFTGTRSYTVYGPDVFILGQFTRFPVKTNQAGPFRNFGLNDDFATDALIQLMKQNKLPDFTMVYWPSNDTVVHRYGVGATQGIARVDRNIQRVLSSYGSWGQTLKHLTLVVMGDGGVTQVLAEDQRPTIFVEKLFSKRTVYRWGRAVQPGDDIVIAPNSRMTYVYLLSPHFPLAQAVKQLKRDRRIDVIAWADGADVMVTKPEQAGTPLRFHKYGPLADPYGQTWTIIGKPSLLDVRVLSHRKLIYGNYPDVLHQLWSAAHCQQGAYVIVTAKQGYQFGDDGAPQHAGGAQQASLISGDVYTPLIINASYRVPQDPHRFIDLKKYFISLVAHR